MSASDIIKQLLKAYANGDSEMFRKSALQLASNESRIGHSKLAEEIREIIAKFPSDFLSNPETISLAQPRGELSGLIDGSFRKEKLRDLVLSTDLRQQLERIVFENHRRSTLQKAGLAATRRLLFFGPPGCGKTLSAKALAGELNMPLMTIRFDALFSRYLGATANHLRTIFEEMPKRPGVYFFDEFDAVGKNRGDDSDVGETKRVVSSFLQLMDSDTSASLIIAATNFERSIDPAAVRRFDTAIHFGLPTTEQIAALLMSRLGNYSTSNLLAGFVKNLVRFSFADVTRICDDALRSMVLKEKNKVSQEDLQLALSKTKQLHNLLRKNKVQPSSPRQR